MHDHPGVRFKFELESTGEPLAAMPDEAVLRILSHVLIERLPPQAISSVWEAIYDTWEWHSRQRLPAAPEGQAKIPAVNRVFSVVEEPPFQIAEE